MKDICDTIRNLSVIKDYDLSIISSEFHENVNETDILENQLLIEGLLLLNITSILSIHNVEEDNTTFDVKFMNGESVNC